MYDTLTDALKEAYRRARRDYEGEGIAEFMWNDRVCQITVLFNPHSQKLLMIEVRDVQTGEILAQGTTQRDVLTRFPQ